MTKLIIFYLYGYRLAMVMLTVILSMSDEMVWATHGHPDVVMQDVIDCKCMVRGVYDGNSLTRYAGADERYQKLAEFTQFPSADSDIFMRNNNISEESFKSVLGHVYTKKDGQGLFIAFRGTVYMDEWVSNLDVEASSASLLCTSTPGYIHKGFLEGVSGFCKHLERIILDNIGDMLSNPDYEIVLTGHSRGAAFALLYAIMLQKALSGAENRIKVITFSAPHDVIGDANFWKHYYSKIGGMNIVMFYNDLDIVPIIGELSENICRLRLGYVSPISKRNESVENRIFVGECNAFGVIVPVIQADNAPVLIRNIAGGMLGILTKYMSNFSYEDLKPGIFKSKALKFVGGLVRESLSELAAFTHQMLPDRALDDAFRSILPEYIKRWTKEIYFPRELTVLGFEHEIFQWCNDRLSDQLRKFQEDHNSISGFQLVSIKVNDFLKKCEEILRNPGTLEEKSMDFVHFIIRNTGIDLIKVSPLLVNVERKWRSVAIQAVDTRYLQLPEPKGFSLQDLSENDAGLSPDADIAIAKIESRRAAEKEGKVGPRTLSGWEIEDVEDRGNCFYEAVGRQMQLQAVEIDVPEGTLIRDVLRLRVQGADFKDLEWAEDTTIDEFVKKFPNCILAIVDTRYPATGFRYYYVSERGEILHAIEGEALPGEKTILRIAATGNHFMSVRQFPL